jgi:hypothetical protein
MVCEWPGMFHALSDRSVQAIEAVILGTIQILKFRTCIDYTGRSKTPTHL